MPASQAQQVVRQPARALPGDPDCSRRYWDGRRPLCPICLSPCVGPFMPPKGATPFETPNPPSPLHRSVNGTWVMDITPTQAQALDIHPVEAKLLGTLFVKLCHRNLTTMTDILKGAYVSVRGDRAWYYGHFAKMQDAYRRGSSHRSTREQVGVPEGNILKTLLTGTMKELSVGMSVGGLVRMPEDARGSSSDISGAVWDGMSPSDSDSWFQLEGAQWAPFHRPWDAFVHILNFLEYRITGRNVGPLGSSKFTDRSPLYLKFAASTDPS